jgi:hypothetical protein
MVREGVPALGIFGYDGMLFAEDQTPLLDNSPSPVVSGEGPGVRACRNSDLLRAIRALTLIEREGVLQRISYADLGVEELGSIYESLLDYTPRVTTIAEEVDGRPIPANTFFLDPRGAERKTTGSYYTHPSLVNELIKSALLPVARDRLAKAGLPVVEEAAIGEATTGLLTDYAGLSEAQRAAGKVALLGITVCDPAAGSGHFLVKANNALGAELARIGSGDDYPAEAQVQAAKRDVLAHCIYAVDLNPMAVELCKVSLWINASVADRPLSFLDHHIRCGNSLIGATPELMAKGIPAEAFDPDITGNDPATTKRVRIQSRQEQRDYEAGGGYQPTLFHVRLYAPDGTVQDFYHRLSDLAEEEPQAARERYTAYQDADAHRRQKLEADCWTAAFFWPLTEDGGWVPTFGEFQRLRDEGPQALPPDALAQVEALAKEYRFFHWHLEFPDVFQTPGVSEVSELSSGFDVVLGNPPWETLEFKEKEFFLARDQNITNALTTTARRRVIAELPKTNPALAFEYEAAVRRNECESNFIRASRRFPLASVGKINTYAIFAELDQSSTGPRGRTGVVVQSGIATDYTYRDFFQWLMERQSLCSLHDFENREKLFPDVDSRMKFSLLTLSGSKWPCPAADFAFFLHAVDDLANDERHFRLSPEDLAVINPNTRTCPVFRNRRDAELTRKLYRACPILHNEESDENFWDVSFKQGLFNMSSDSHLFHVRDELEREGLVLEGNRFRRGIDLYLPLYEGRMFHQFDHRSASVGVTEETTFRSGVRMETSLEDHRTPNYVVLPRYWVVSRVVLETTHSYGREWFVVFKDVTSPTNERAAIFSIIPWAAVGHTAPILFTAKASVAQVCGLVANLNSCTLDFVARQKMGGIHLTFFILHQLPILPPTRYTPDLLDFIVPRVVELTYTAWDLQPFAQDVLAEVGAETWARWLQGAPVHASPPPAGRPRPRRSSGMKGAAPSCGPSWTRCTRTCMG